MIDPTLLLLLKILVGILILRYAAPFLVVALLGFVYLAVMAVAIPLALFEELMYR